MVEKPNVVLVFMDKSSWKWDWDEKNHRPKSECRLDVWSARSSDNGKTWTDFTCMMKGYCGSLFDIIQTRDGWIVVPMHFGAGIGTADDGQRFTELYKGEVSLLTVE